MARESTIPQQLMTAALLHFESGVPITDLNVRREHKDRLVRVQHVYWQWVKNPFLEPFELFKQLIKSGAKQYADPQSAWRAAQKDKWLFDFVVEHINISSRRQDEAKVRAASERMIRIGMETDNVMALDKGSKRLFEVAGLDKPGTEQTDMNKVAFMPTVVVTDIRQIDDSKTFYDDEETKRIIAKYGAHVDAKHQDIDDKVALMEARVGASEITSEHDDE